MIDSDVGIATFTKIWGIFTDIFIANSPRNELERMSGTVGRDGVDMRRGVP